MSGGSKLVRVCNCEDSAPESLERHARQLLGPGCQLWPAVSQLASAGEPLFPGWAGEKVPTVFRGGADRMGARSFRRGAARATREEGGSFPWPLRSGQWRSSAYRLYLGLGREGPGAIASILIEASEEE